MKCIECGGDSRVLRMEGERERLRECTGCRRRWYSIELLQRHTLTEPATRETVLLMRARGMQIREIATALLMSSKTVMVHLEAQEQNLTIESVWKT